MEERERKGKSGKICKHHPRSYDKTLLLAVGQSDDQRSWSVGGGGKSPQNTKSSGLIYA